LSTCPAVPVTPLIAEVPLPITTPVIEETPVPPLLTAKVPVHPAVIETDFNNAVEGVPPRVNVTFVSSVLVRAPAELKEGVVELPVELPNQVLDPALDNAKLKDGVVVLFDTEVVNNGDKLPALKLVTVPVPPPGIAC